jgi:hypothetical protein
MATADLLYGVYSQEPLSEKQCEGSRAGRRRGFCNPAVASPRRTRFRQIYLIFPAKLGQRDGGVFGLDSMLSHSFWGKV